MDNYKTKTYIYFDFLITIHNEICHDDEYDIVRGSKEEVKKCNNILKDLFVEIANNKNSNEILEKLLNICGFLLLIQPFYDGNTRTIKTFMILILKFLNYKITPDEKSLEQIIPLFYSEKDKCDEQHMLKLKKILIRNTN